MDLVQHHAHPGGGGLRTKILLPERLRIPENGPAMSIVIPVEVMVEVSALPSRALARVVLPT